MSLSHDQRVSVLRRSRGVVIGVNRQVRPPTPVTRIIPNRASNQLPYGRPVAVSVSRVSCIDRAPPDAVVCRPTSLMDILDPTDRMLAEAMRRARIGR